MMRGRVPPMAHGSDRLRARLQLIATIVFRPLNCIRTAWEHHGQLSKRA